MPSTGKHPNSFAIHSPKSLHWTIFVSERDSRLIANPSVLRCFLRSSLTEVPSLHRSCPVSQVLRTPPPPHTARSISHE